MTPKSRRPAGLVEPWTGGRDGETRQLDEGARDPELVIAGARTTASIPPDRHRSGLRNLTERATSLGGIVDVKDNHPHGTVVELRAPLNHG
ncbi:hypothetical protein AB0F43_20750 [Kribbella sp. NPDC023972]|uniref:hypothetical protein n=1 Tax=Kribbella sp. NPDC023972 TaxID=3154795 RepID=UPI0033ED0755